MDSDNGLVTAYIIDDEGNGEHLNWEQLNDCKVGTGFLWVHLDFSHPNAQRWLEEESNLSDLNAYALMEDEIRPRVTAMKDGLLVMLRGVNMNPGADPEDMVSLRLWVDKNRVISTRKRCLQSIKDVQALIEEDEGPKSPGDLLAMLSERLVHRMADVIESVDEEIDLLENLVVESNKANLRHELASLRIKVISLRRYLAPQREIMLSLSTEKNSIISDYNRMMFREISNRIIRYVEDLDSVRDRATVVQDELASRLSEQINNRMYTLSIVAAVFLPLGFITGLLGINVGGIPGSENPFGFEWVIGILILLLGMQIWIFKRQRWF